MNADQYAEVVAAMTRNINEKERSLREQVAHHSHRADVAEEIADRLAARLDKVSEVLAEWGATPGEDAFAEEFAEAIRESGAWRLARDLYAAIRSNRPERGAE